MLTSETVENLWDFVDYVQGLEGDEKGEAQVFCDRLFHAFGHEGYKEAGATLEYRVRKKGRGTKFADLLWRPRLLLEMKKRGEKLERHYSQAFDCDWGEKLLIQNWACLEKVYGGHTSGSIREHRAAAGKLQLLGRGSI